MCGVKISSLNLGQCGKYMNYPIVLFKLIENNTEYIWLNSFQFLNYGNNIISCFNKSFSCGSCGIFNDGNSI